jgi:hypothetical protein
VTARRPSLRGKVGLEHGAWLPVLALSLLAGCANEVRPGTIARVPLTVGPLGPRQGAPVALTPPRDVRPSVEHQGQEDKIRFFFTVGIVTHWERAGNYVTNDEEATSHAAAELGDMLTQALRVSRAAEIVPGQANAAFTLETEIVHLYATHYDVTEGTVVVLNTRRGLLGGGAGVTGRQYASYGNVLLRAKLVDRRTGSPVTVWEEHVAGSGQAMPSKEHVESAQTALRMAVGEAAGTLSIRIAAVLDRLGTGPNGAGYELTGQLPPVFLIERVSRLRDFLETLFVETRSGQVLRHDIVPLADRSYGRPGEWLLSRRTPEGIVLSGAGYEAFARSLATKYDLRAYDDAQRFHFFGVRGVGAPPNEAPE